MPAEERPPVHVLLIRHGQQVREGQDGPLTPTGQEQAIATGAAIGLTEADRLVSSTRRRAVDTAAAFGRPPEQVADLDEFRFGESWSWADADEREDLRLWRPEHRTPGGESLGEFQERVAAAWDALMTEPPEGRLIVVVHAGVIDATFRWVYGLGPKLPGRVRLRPVMPRSRSWSSGPGAAGPERRRVTRSCFGSGMSVTSRKGW